MIGMNLKTVYKRRDKMKWIYVILIIVTGCVIPCPDKIYNCLVEHRKIDTVYQYFCDKKSMQAKQSQMYIIEWKGDDGCMYRIIEKKVDSLLMTQHNIDSINNLK